MSTSSHVPSSRASADRPHRLGRVGHVVDAVERRDEVDRPVSRQRLLTGVVEVGVRQAQLDPATLRPLQGEVGDVVAMDLAGRVGLRDEAHGDARPAADVGHRPAGLQPLDHIVQRR
jgi:hypothetical protein